MLYFFLVLFLVIALVSPLLFRLLRRFTGLLAILPASFFVWSVFQIEKIQTGEIIKNVYWLIPQLQIGLNFSLDGLSLIFVLIISFIGALVLIYSVPYFRASRELARFLPLLIFFSAAMLGIVMANDLITLFICWELTSISSYFLIAFEHEEKEAREAAWKALIVTAAGGLGLLAGFLILGNISGTFAIDAIVNSPALLRNGMVIPALLLILFGAFTKSAQYPFHSWLPSAMTAPTPVSAYLHSAAMVQAGVYLLFRIYPLFHATAVWMILLMIFGGASMILAGFKAIGQKDLKKILAYATISALGLIIFLIGVGTEKALEAAIIFMILHAAYKGGLFLVAGILDKKLHTRDIRKLSGLFRFMPVTAIAAILLAASNAGLPPFLGFIGKELIYKSTVEYSNSVIFTTCTFLANIGIIATAFMAGFNPFFGKQGKVEAEFKIAADFYLPPLILGAIGLVAGILPAFTTKFLLDPVLLALTGSTSQEPLKLWHGFNTILAISIITIVAGIVAYYLRDKFSAIDTWITNIRWLNTNYLYEKTFAGLFKVAELQTRFFMHGYLKWYVFIAIAFLLLLSLPAIFQVPFTIQFTIDRHYYISLIALLAIVSGVVSITSKTMLMSIAALGGVGFSIALIFVLLGAPDLAITLFAVETLTVLLFVFVVYKLPRPTVFSGKKMIVADILISIMAGTMITMLILFTHDMLARAEIRDFFLVNSYKLAHGKNVVNVILTDFRAMDTLGETVVLATAGLGVYTLLKVAVRKRSL